MSELYDAWLELTRELYSLIDGFSGDSRELAIWKVNRAGARLERAVSEITPERYPAVDSKALFMIEKFAEDWGRIDKAMVSRWEYDADMTKLFGASLRGANDAVFKVRDVVDSHGPQSTAEPVPPTIRWSRPDSPSEWAKVFGTTARKFSKWVKLGRIRAKQIDEKNIMIDMAQLPATRTR